MGYYVTITDSQFLIPERRDVLAAIYEMDTKFHEAKRGNANGTRYFIGASADLKTFKTVGAVFSHLGFDIYEDDGYVAIEGYNGKAYQEDLFLAVVAPFVMDGSFIEWVGEEGERWRHSVHEGRLVTQAGTVVWSEPKQFAYWFIKDEGEAKVVFLDPYDPTTLDSSQTS